jgi:hypothetical protein
MLSLRQKYCRSGGGALHRSTGDTPPLLGCRMGGEMYTNVYHNKTKNLAPYRRVPKL